MSRHRTVFAANLILLAVCPVSACVVAFSCGPDQYLGLIHEETRAAQDVTGLAAINDALFRLVCCLDVVLALSYRSIRMALACCAFVMTAHQLTPTVFRFAYASANGDICL